MKNIIDAICLCSFNWKHCNCDHVTVHNILTQAEELFSIYIAMHRNDRMVSNTVLILNLHITLFVKAQRPLFFLMDIYWIRQTVLWFPWGANKTIDQKYKNVGFIRINHFFLGVNHTTLSAYTQPPQMKWSHGETWYLHTHASNYALHIYLYILCRLLMFWALVESTPSSGAVAYYQVLKTKPKN